MEMVPFLMFMFALIPIMTGVGAREFNRSFWRWFLVGCFLPGLSFFILYWAVRNEPDPADPAPILVAADLSRGETTVSPGDESSRVQGRFSLD